MYSSVTVTLPDAELVPSDAVHFHVETYCTESLQLDLENVTPEAVVELMAVDVSPLTHVHAYV